MNYQYNALNSDQAVASGRVQAVSEKMAEEALYRAGFKYVLNLKAVPGKKTLSQLIPSLFGVKTRDIIDFSRQLASFLDSGSSLRVALELLKDQATKPAMRKVITDINNRLEEGNPFSLAIKDYPEVFPFSYYQVIQSCEKSGDLVQGLNQIADYMEKRAIINDKIKRALAYPAFVILLAIGVIVMMVTTVLPPILKLFSSFQADLPKVTVYALGILNFFLEYKLVILIVIIMLIAGIYLTSRFPAGKKPAGQGSTQNSGGWNTDYSDQPGPILPHGHDVDVSRTGAARYYGCGGQGSQPQSGDSKIVCQSKNSPDAGGWVGPTDFTGQIISIHDGQNDQRG